MSVFLVIVALAVVVIVAVFVAGHQQRMPDEPHDRVPADLPEGRIVVRADIDRLRFATEFRGYRMDQVDAVLERLASDIDRLAEHRDRLDEQVRAAGLNPATSRLDAVERAVSPAPRQVGDGPGPGSVSSDDA